MNILAQRAIQIGSKEYTPDAFRDNGTLSSLTTFVEDKTRLKARDIPFSIVFRYYCVVNLQILS
ncbi:MAG: hypothetical protein WAV76_14925 [Bacteroidota bacterium]